MATLEEDVISKEGEVKVFSASADTRADLKKLLLDAVAHRASDIHFGNMSDGRLRIRYRIDGVLHTRCYFRSEDAHKLICAIKVWAEMQVDKTRIPQDGRIMVREQDKEFDLRVSSVPAGIRSENRYETIVIRILDKTNVPPLSDLGLHPHTEERLLRLVNQPNGMIIFTGPTGSGKTTTQYALLRIRNQDSVNIITVEDPIEYEINGVTQIPVSHKVDRENPGKYLNFSSALRAIVRQDPDIVMVGEMRDKETAEVAMEASLTGHLVLTTLHANDAPSTVTRLVDMGVEPFLISATVMGVQAQRLARRICQKCKTPYTANSEDLGILASTPQFDRLEGATLYKGEGCKECSGTGFKGRVGIYELMEVDDEIGSLVCQKASAAAVRKLAVERGMRTLLDDGIDKILSGLTTPIEVGRVVFTAHE